MQRSLQCSHCWKHCLESSTEMLSRAASEFSLNLCNVRKTPSFQILLHPWVQKKVARSEVRWVGGTPPPYFLSQKLQDASLRSACSVFLKKSPNTCRQKKCNNKNDTAHSALSLGRLVQNIVGSLYLVAEPWTLSRSCGRFKFRKYLGPPLYVSAVSIRKQPNWQSFR